jgi:hypothetical protein
VFIEAQIAFLFHPSTSIFTCSFSSPIVVRPPPPPASCSAPARAPAPAPAHHLTGTKLGCNEGGCGACTVLVSHFDRAARRVVNRAVNACLAPAASIDGCHVITVEGLGSTRRGLHPVQARISEFHGSQVNGEVIYMWWRR